MSAKRKSLWVLAGVWAFFFTYAIFRYVVFGVVPANQIPLYIFNKSLAASASVILALSVTIGPVYRVSGWGRGALLMRPYLGIFGTIVLALHLAIVLLLLSPTYFPKFFLEDNLHLNLVGQFAILFGLLSFSLMLPLALTSVSVVRQMLAMGVWDKLHRWAWFAVLMGAMHVSVIAIPSWLTPDKWPMGMLPVTLLVSLAIFASVFARAGEFALGWVRVLASRYITTKL